MFRPYLFHGISFSFPDLSNDSYSTAMGLEDGASPHSNRGSYSIHGNGSTPPYLSSHSPPPTASGYPYNSYPDNIVYTSIGGYPSPTTMLRFCLSAGLGGAFGCLFVRLVYYLCFSKALERSHWAPARISVLAATGRYIKHKIGITPPTPTLKYINRCELFCVVHGDSGGVHNNGTYTPNRGLRPELWSVFIM